MGGLTGQRLLQTSLYLYTFTRVNIKYSRPSEERAGPTIICNKHFLISPWL